MTIDEIIAAERDNAEFSKASNYDKSAFQKVEVE